MAGAGYKLFQTGDVLTAAQVNTYLNEQTVMVFASAAARTSALTSVLAEGMVSYLQDTNAVEVYDGSAWVSIGASGDITGITTGATSGLTGGVTSGTADLKLNTTAKGGLLVGTGSGTVTELSVGTNNHILTADSSTASGLKWAAAASGGKVLQVVSATTTTATTIATDTLTDTGITASITPSSASSKVLVLVTAEFKHFRNGAGFTGIAAELLRGATTIADWNKTDADEFDFIQYAGSSANVYKSGTTTVVYLDSPATTSSTTYKLQARGYDSSVSVTFQKNSAISTITLLEIGA